jgi:hypothetical protein
VSITRRVDEELDEAKKMVVEKDSDISFLAIPEIISANQL